MYFRTIRPDNKKHKDYLLGQGLSAPFSLDIPKIEFFMAKTVKRKGNGNTLSSHLQKQRLDGTVSINSVLCFGSILEQEVRVVKL